MLLDYLVLAVALILSGVAAYYSVVGLAAIFSGAFLSVVLMGSALELGKLVAASWLYRNWEEAPKLIKYYLSVAIVILMFITSMGIFGFLSKAHIEQTTITGDNSLQIELLDKKIQREQKRITDAELVISQLDQAVQTLMDYDRVRGPNGAIATREKQKAERADLNVIIDNAQVIITELQQEKFILNREQIAFEAEVGPIKYIADFIYGEADKKLIEKAVRAVIVIIVLVFDPLAIILLIAANRELKVISKPVRGRPKGSKNKLIFSEEDNKISVDKDQIHEMKQYIPSEILERVFKK